MIAFLLFTLSALAADVVLMKSTPIEAYSRLQVVTTYDNRDFMGYHTVVFEDIIQRGEDVRVLYSSRTTMSVADIAVQHNHSFFYAMHLHNTHQLLSQNQNGTSPVSVELDEELLNTIGYLYPIAEGCE